MKGDAILPDLQSCVLYEDVRFRPLQQFGLHRFPLLVVQFISAQPQ